MPVPFDVTSKLDLEGRRGHEGLNMGVFSTTTASVVRIRPALARNLRHQHGGGGGISAQGPATMYPAVPICIHEGDRCSSCFVAFIAGVASGGRLRMHSVHVLVTVRLLVLRQ